MADDFIQQLFTSANQAELEARFVVVVWLFALGLWLAACRAWSRACWCCWPACS